MHLYNNHLVHAGEGGAGGKSGASTAHLYGQMVLGRVQTTDSNQEETIYEEPLGEQHPFNSTRCIFDTYFDLLLTLTMPSNHLSIFQWPPILPSLTIQWAFSTKSGPEKHETGYSIQNCCFVLDLLHRLEGS